MNVRTPYWECVLCAKQFTTLDGWTAHVQGRPNNCVWTERIDAPVLTEADVRRIVREELAAMSASKGAGNG